MIDAYKKLWTKAFDFRGRSNRHDYWWAALANLLVSYVLLALGYYVSEAFSGIYYLVRRKGFSKVFAWATVILCFMAYLGESYYMKLNL